MNDALIPVYVLGGIGGVIGSLVFLITVVIPRISGYKQKKKLRLTMPDFNWKVIKESDYPNNTKIYIDGVPIYCKLFRGLGANGIYGIGKIEIEGIAEEREYEIKFKLGQNVFRFFQEWDRFFAMCKENNVEVVASQSLWNGVKAMRKELEKANNLKIIEENENEKK